MTHSKLSSASIVVLPEEEDPVLKQVVAFGLVACLAGLPVTVVAQSPGSRSMADRVATLEAQLAAALAAIADLQNRSGVPAGQHCADGSFVMGFDDEGGVISARCFTLRRLYPSQVDFNFAYNANRSNPIVLFQNQSSGVEVLFLDGRPFHEVLTSTIVGLSFTTNLLDVPFDFDDTIVVRTSEGNVFKVGEPVLHDNSTVSFRYRQLSFHIRLRAHAAAEPAHGTAPRCDGDGNGARTRAAGGAGRRAAE